MAKKKTPSVKHTDPTAKPKTAKKGPKKKISSVNVKAALKEGLLVAPSESFTVAEARKAMVKTIFNDQAMTAVLRSMSGSRGLLEARPDGRFEIRDSNRGGVGSDLRGAILRVLCTENPGQAFGCSDLARLVNDRVAFAFDRGDVCDMADRMPEIELVGGKYRCVGT